MLAACGPESTSPSTHIPSTGAFSIDLQPSPAELEDIALIAETYGLTLQTAVDRYGGQGRFIELVDELRAGYPEDFAGSAWTPGGAHHGVLVFAAEAPFEVEQHRLAAGLDLEVRTHAGWTEQGLEAQQLELHHALVGAGFDVVSAADAELGIIEVQIAVSQPELERIHQSYAGLLGAANVVVEAVEALPGKDEVLYGGGRLENPNSSGLSCTAAFAVRSGSREGMLTAGHCPNALTLENESGDPEHTGTLRGEHLGSWGDFQWFSYTTDSVDSFFYWDTGRRRDAWRSRSVSKGISVCRFGHRTGRHCDEIYKTGVSAGGEDRLAMTRNENADGGDSGGPWYYGNTIYGVHKGEKWAWFKRRDIFSQMQYADDALGVSPILCTPYRTSCYDYECDYVSIGCGRTLYCGTCNNNCPTPAFCSDGSCCPENGRCSDGSRCLLVPQ